MRDSELVKVAKALADPTRVRILRAIRAKGEFTCADACDQFPLSQPTISHHVKVLEAAGLITVRRQGQFHALTVNEKLLAGFAGAWGPAAAAPPAPRKRAAARRPSPAGNP